MVSAPLEGQSLLGLTKFVSPALPAVPVVSSVISVPVLCRDATHLKSPGACYLIPEDGSAYLDAVLHVDEDGDFLFTLPSSVWVSLRSLFAVPAPTPKPNFFSFTHRFTTDASVVTFCQAFKCNMTISAPADFRYSQVAVTNDGTWAVLKDGSPQKKLSSHSSVSRYDILFQ